MRKKKILIIVFILIFALTGISVGHYFWKESKKMVCRAGILCKTDGNIYGFHG